MLTQGIMDAAIAVAGKKAAQVVGSKIPSVMPGATGQAVNQALTALVIGFVAQRVPGLRGDRARLLVQGALQAPIETLLNPVFSSLGLGSYVGVGSYPAVRRLGAYSPTGVGAYPGVNPAARLLAGDPERVDAAFVGM